MNHLVVAYLISIAHSTLKVARGDARNRFMEFVVGGDISKRLGNQVIKPVFSVRAGA
jgi:hypothetical protein